MSKLDDALERWQVSRAKLLETRKKLKEAREQADRALADYRTLLASEGVQAKSLSERATQLSELLHCDVAGIAGQAKNG